MSYSLTKSLPSCFVEKRLLQELESYMQQKVADFARSDNSLSNKFEFNIVDSSGSETLKSVEDFKKTYFPDDTQRLKMQCGRKWREEISIEISFSPSKFGSEVEIWFDGNSAREVTAGIYAEILSILKSYKTSNHWFHDWYGFKWFMILWVISFPLSTFIFRANTWTKALVQGSVQGTVLILLTVVFVRIFKPYSTFETRRTERRRKQINWIILGIISFILFTVLGVYFRQKLFGF